MPTGISRLGLRGRSEWVASIFAAVWAVFTCGPELRNAFRRLRIPLLDLAAADPMALDEDERMRWGSYYDQQPRVMAASVAESHAVLSNLFKDECKLHALWHGALRAGSTAA
jgi:hypothetical protein